MPTKNIFLTGHRGFLGMLLTKALTEQGFKVCGYDFADGDDILDKERLRTKMEACRPELVIHLAAVADLYLYAKNPDAHLAINVTGTQNVTTIAKELDAPVLFASTCCIYGNNECHPSDETSPTCPTEPYAISKKISEPQVIEADPRNVCMRLATFYGGKMRAALAPAVFIERSFKGVPIEIHGTGEQTRTLTHVSDIVSGIVALVKERFSGRPMHNVYNITTTESVSVLELIDIVFETTSKPVECIKVEDRFGQIKKEHILADRMAEIGWKASVSIREGIKESYESFLKDGAKWNTWEGVSVASE